VSGGQVSDTGILSSKEGLHFLVSEVKQFGIYVLHVGHVSNGTVKVGDEVTCVIDIVRRKPIMANHTSTHMLNFGLRKVLGDNSEQKGSEVDDTKLRFDFSYNDSLQISHLKNIDDVVVGLIKNELPIYSKEIPKEQAEKITGLRKVFNEKYPDPVRVVAVGVPIEELQNHPDNPKWMDYSIEFCGGTHLKNSAEAEAFTIISEESIGTAVRRIVAVTGDEARAAISTAELLEAKMKEIEILPEDKLKVKVAEFVSEIDTSILPAWRKLTLKEKIEVLQNKIKQIGKKSLGQAVDQVTEIVANLKEKGQKFYVSRIELKSQKPNKALTEAARKLEVAGIAALLIHADPSKKKKSIFVLAKVPEALIGKLDAGEWIKETTSVLGGNGGGKPSLAQGFGDNISAIELALEKATSFAETKLK